jgi:S-adenosyl methyltransferase
VTEPEHAPCGIDVTTPNVARMYDYSLGGKDNFAADREAVEKVLAVAPGLPAGARANRRFLGRAVRYVAGRGVHQFVDLGAGLPSQGNVHEVAREVRPDARVVYVDHDPVVAVHARAILAGDDRSAAIQADLRRPEGVLGHEAVARLIDFSRPVAVLFVASLHFVTDEEDPAGIVRAFADRMADGSYLILSHVTHDGQRPEQVQVAKYVYRGATAPWVFRGRDEVLRLFDGFTLVEPGLVRLSQWRADDVEAKTMGGDWAYAGVARKGHEPSER